MKFTKIAIMGPGLLGGSLALAIRARQLSGQVSLYTRSATSIEPLSHSGVADEITTDPARAVVDAELVILCVPIGAMPDVVAAMKPKLSSSTIVTDVASVKGKIVREFEVFFTGVAHWVGSHPMAGSEKSGFGAAREDLFVGARTLVTPVDSTNPKALETVISFWQALGSTVLQCSPDEHDRRVAQISHLPHVMAAALAISVDAKSLAFSGPGFRDTTRVAEGPAAMWAEILQTNDDAVLQSLDNLMENMNRVRSMIKNKKEKELRDWLAQASQIRSNLH